MTAYAIARLRGPSSLHPDIVTYLERIQDTLDPFSGRFLVHGGAMDVVEGEWQGAVVMIEFPSMDEGHAWYHSAAYQEILPLRTTHIDGDCILVQGVGPDYHPSTKIEQLRRAEAV